LADGWCWIVLTEECCWLVAGGWFVLLVADKPTEQAGPTSQSSECQADAVVITAPPHQARLYMTSYDPFAASVCSRKFEIKHVSFFLKKIYI
jgi:hypothetical protein